jgi:hypothetical protein
MDKRIKKRWIILVIEAVVLSVLITLGLIVSPWFIVSAVFIWLGFVLYQTYLGPGGPW